MNLKILDQAEADLIEGFHFYESQQSGIGAYYYFVKFFGILRKSCEFHWWLLKIKNVVAINVFGVEPGVL